MKRSVASARNSFFHRQRARVQSLAQEISEKRGRPKSQQACGIEEPAQRRGETVKTREGTERRYVRNFRAEQTSSVAHSFCSRAARCFQLRPTDIRLFQFLAWALKVGEVGKAAVRKVETKTRGRRA